MGSSYIVIGFAVPLTYEIYKKLSVLFLLTILYARSAPNNKKWIGMKKRRGNSLLKSLLISPNLNKNVFHNRVKAQKINRNCIRAFAPANTNVMTCCDCRLMPALVVSAG